MTEEKTLFIDQGPMQIKKNVQMANWVKALLALLPALIFLVLFTIFPIINTIFISFVKDFSFRPGTGSIAFLSFFRQIAEHNNPDAWFDPDVPFEIPPLPEISFANYIKVLNDQVFLNALGNTAILTIISVPLTIIISIFIAVSLNSIKVLRATFQTIFFLPYVTNSIALGLVFNTLFSPYTGGIMNQLLAVFNIKPIAWINSAILDPNITPTSKLSVGFAITVQTIWNGLAFKILIFMAGLASIDKQYYDAARIDGAKKKTILKRITIPLLSPQILYITITSFIGAFKAYQSIIAIIGKGAENFGGADGKMWITVVGYIYINRTGSSPNLPSASAGAVILLVIVLIITLIQMQVSKRRVHY